jgi:hypothetical protein
MWDQSYVPWCAANGVRPYAYDPVGATNFLEFIQSKYEKSHDAQNKPRNHSVFKHARAAVGAMFEMFHPHKPPLAEWTHIKNIAQTLRVTAPNLPKHSETISLDPVFAALVNAWKHDVRFETADMKQLRDWTSVLVRIRLMCRSADVVCINRIWTDDPLQQSIAGMSGISPAASDAVHPVSVRKVRFDFPKNRRSVIRAGPWKDLGGYLRDSPYFKDEFSLCCARHALEVYLARTADLPRAPFVDQLRPSEQIQRVFISVPKRQGEHYPIRPGTIGQVIKAILKKLGFDVTKFQGHILRSAALRATIDATQDPVATLSVASVSEKVFHIFYVLRSSPAGSISNSSYSR